MILSTAKVFHEGEIIALGEKLAIISKSTGSSYTYTDPKTNEEVKLGRGYDATRTFLKENQKLSADILKQIRARFGEIQVSSAAE